MWNKLDKIIAYNLVIINGIFIFFKCKLSCDESRLSVIFALSSGVLYNIANKTDTDTLNYQLVHSFFHLFSSIGTLVLLIGLNKN